MGLFLPVRNSGTVAIAVCQRCNKKMPYSELYKDPNNGMMVCKDDLDIYDPWRLPARVPENISLEYPRTDVMMSDLDNTIATEQGIAVNFPPEVSIP